MPVPSTTDTSRRAASSPSVHPFGSADSGDWQAYVERHPSGTLFHTLGWLDALKATFRHPDRYLIARRGERVSGVLPLVEVSSLFFGTTLISVPFGVYGGMLVDDDESAAALLDGAGDVARRRNAKYVELRHLTSPLVGLPRTDIYSTFVADVPGNADDCLARLPKKARAEVRKAMRDSELVAEIDTTSLDELYHLFSLNKRKLGSPIFPSSLFWHLKNRFGDSAKMLSVKRGGRTLCAVMAFIHQGTIMPYYSGSVPDSEQYSASNFMYYKLMEWAAAQGLRRFDFGRSRSGTGAYQFKKNQGFEPTQLSYEYILNRADSIPALNPSNPKFELARRVFNRLPLWAAQRVGSWITKRAPF